VAALYAENHKALTRDGFTSITITVAARPSESVVAVAFAAFFARAAINFLAGTNADAT
jgi:hypothetical protein